MPRLSPSDLDKLYQEIFRKNVEWSNTHEPMMVAGIFLAQALKFYKSALSSEEYEDMLIVAFIENGGTVEQYICPVRNIKEAHKKNTLSDLQWKRRQIFSVGNVIVREW